MATAVDVARRAAGAANQARKRRADRRAVVAFGEFWTALQQVGDALEQAEKLAKRTADGTWRHRRSRHWELATVQEIRLALRACRGSLRIISAQAKRFEPQLITKEWRR